MTHSCRRPDQPLHRAAADLQTVGLCPDQSILVCIHRCQIRIRPRERHARDQKIERKRLTDRYTGSGQFDPLLRTPRGVVRVLYDVVVPRKRASFPQKHNFF